MAPRNARARQIAMTALSQRRTSPSARRRGEKDVRSSMPPRTEAP